MSINNLYTVDCETVGFHGMPVLLQWAKGDGPINLHSIWEEPIRDTLNLIEEIANTGVLGFNLAFDWFHINKLYTTLAMFEDYGEYPQNIINELGYLEERARFTDVCVKPAIACDVMLHARRGPWQSLMDRDDIRIKRVPVQIANLLAEELNQRIRFDPIYFSRSKKKITNPWTVKDCKNSEGVFDPHFRNIELKFRASSALKALAKQVYNLKDDNVLLFRDIHVGSEHLPDELGYAPFALALTPKGKDSYWTGTFKGKAVRSWPSVINAHITHWGHNDLARKYAGDDIDYTRRLAKDLKAVPGDNDSTLACMVACCRWKGYAIDERALRYQRKLAAGLIAGGIPHAPAAVKRYLLEVTPDETDRLGIELRGTGKVVLQEIISEWKNEDGTRHPAAERAELVLARRKAEKKIDMIDKLLRARRLHANFKVMGALSNRMSGDGGVNTQGIDHTTQMRGCFPLYDEYLIPNDPESGESDFTLSGGDFKSFEVSLAVTVFKDEGLKQELLSGKKIHAMLGKELFPGETYETVCASEGTDHDMYDTGKKGVFLMFYGGDENTYRSKLGIALEIGARAVRSFQRRFPGIGRFGKEVEARFGALWQPNGIGSRVDWHEPQEYAETFLGFRRYFTLENRIARVLFDMAQKPPASWAGLKIKVRRRDRVQTGSGATQSALYGAAFQIIAGIIRAAKNHYIQSPGAEIAKAVQRNIWDHQPSGVSKWIVQPFNVHDEIETPVRKGYEEKVEQTVKTTVAKYQKIVELLKIDWVSGIKNWASKKGVPYKPTYDDSLKT